jgi:hypothetical protein
MSVNQILNRPLFRKEALKKGHLKPIKASTGAAVSNFPLVPVGTPVGGPIQGNPRMLPSTQVIKPGWGARFKANFLGTPYGQSFWKLAGKDAINFPRQMTRNPLSTMMAQRSTLPFGTGGGISRLLGFGGIYDTVDPYVGQYIQNPLGRAAVSTGLSVLGAMNPYVRAAGVAKSLYGIGKNLIYDPAKAAIAAHRATPVAQRQVLPSISGEAAMEEIDVSTPKEVMEQVKVESKARPGSGRVGFENRLAQSENKDPLENNLIDIDKVVKNNVPDFIGNQKMGSQPPGEEVLIAKKSEDITDKGGKIKVTEKEQEEDIIKSNGETSVIKQASKITAGDGTPITDDTIQRAREIRDELMAGKSSQAKLVFMANLASGLLSGTTDKAGIGGALEVFGKALGPAVNNYATIKLKENELENEFMSDALELAADEIEAKNAVLESPDYPDATPGVVRMLTQKGQPMNVTARQLKDGTVQIAMPGRVDRYGRQIFTTVTPGEYVTFRTSKGAEKGQFQTLRDLSAKYKAYNLGINTIKILEDAEAQDKKFAGPAGRFNLFTTRLGDALNDFNIKISSIEDGNRMAEDLRLQMKMGLINDGKSPEEADKILNKEFGSTTELKNKIFKSLGTFADQTDSANLERLAINETVMVYALANSLKSKDRLTQKDIQMAKNLVNIFPLLRGQRTVIKSLKAVNETVLSDIKRLETDYLDVYFGDSYTINKYRQTYGIGQPEFVGVAGEVQDNPFSGMTSEELLEEW